MALNKLTIRLRGRWDGGQCKQIMDLLEDDVVEKGRDSGFLDDSSLVDMFAPATFEKGLPQDLSRISKQGSEEGGESQPAENQLDQGVLEDNSEERGDYAGGLDDILRGVEDKQVEDVDMQPRSDDLQRVHKFARPLLTSEEIEIAKSGHVEEEVVEIRGRQQGKGDLLPEGESEVRPELSQREQQTEIESTSVQSQGWKCTACLGEEHSAIVQSFCVLY